MLRMNSERLCAVVEDLVTTLGTTTDLLVRTAGECRTVLGNVDWSTTNLEDVDAIPIFACSPAEFLTKKLMCAQILADNAAGALSCDDKFVMYRRMGDAGCLEDPKIQGLYLDYMLYIMSTLVRIITHMPLRDFSSARCLLARLCWDMDVRVDVDDQPLRLRVSGLTKEPLPGVRGHNESFADIIDQMMEHAPTPQKLEKILFDRDAEQTTRFRALLQQKRSKPSVAASEQPTSRNEEVRLPESYPDPTSGHQPSVPLCHVSGDAGADAHISDSLFVDLDSLVSVGGENPGTNLIKRRRPDDDDSDEPPAKRRCE